MYGEGETAAKTATLQSRVLGLECLMPQLCKATTLSLSYFWVRCKACRTVGAIDNQLAENILLHSWCLREYNKAVELKFPDSIFVLSYLPFGKPAGVYFPVPLHRFLAAILWQFRHTFN